MAPIDYRTQTALITGASSGIGAECARQLAQRGADLVLVARREGKLNELAEQLRSQFGVAVTVIPADLGTPDVSTRLAKEIADRGLHVTTLINNAGFGTYGPFAAEDPDRIAAEVSLNVAAVVAITRTFLPQLLAAGTGALVNVASTAGYQPVPGMAVYGATKAFVLSFTQALWQETKGSGLRVTTLSPGSTETEFFDVVGTKAAKVGNFQTSEHVVRTLLSTLDRSDPPPHVILGSGNKLNVFASRFLPRRSLLSMTAKLMQGNKT